MGGAASTTVPNASRAGCAGRASYDGHAYAYAYDYDYCNNSIKSKATTKRHCDFVAAKKKNEQLRTSKIQNKCEGNSKRMRKT